MQFPSIGFDKHLWRQEQSTFTLSAAKDCFSNISAQNLPVVEDNLVRCWPWIAIAACELRYVQQMSNLVSRRKPSEFLQFLRGLEQSARATASGLRELKEHLAAGPLDITAPYVANIADVIGTGLIAINHPNDEVNRTPVAKYMVIEALANELDLVERLIGAFAQSTIRSKGRGPSLPGLPKFVLVLSRVWENVTGRNASVAASITSASDEPPFVKFCQKVAAHAQVKGVSRAMIRGALQTRDLDGEAGE